MPFKAQRGLLFDIESSNAIGSNALHADEVAAMASPFMFITSRACGGIPISGLIRITSRPSVWNVIEVFTTGANSITQFVNYH
jgi:hypothetical protein